VILKESIFFDGRPVGTLSEDILKGRVTFVPADGNKRLAARVWRDVNTAKRDVHIYYLKRGGEA
jgi:hypothetical protein